MPLPVVALPCRSRSMTRTRLPLEASDAARLTVVVVLPTPPFGWRRRGFVRSCFAAVGWINGGILTFLLEMGIRSSEKAAAAGRGVFVAFLPEFR